MNLGPTELLIILVLALIVFGPRKLPDLGKSLGHAMAQFRRASDDFKRSWEQEVELERTRLNEIKQEIEAPVSSDPYSTVADHNEPESYSASESEEPASIEPQGEPQSSEPTPSAGSVARESVKQPSEHWI